MKVLLTGANGFLGSNITRELLEQGYEVRAFVAPGRRLQTLEGLPIEFYKGSILNPAEVDKAVEGCDFVIHAAGSTSIWPSRSPMVLRVNIEGTMNVCRAVKNHNIKKMISVGTANSYGFGTIENPGVETNPYMAGRYGFDYLDSKYEAQEMLRRKAKEENFPVVVVNPTFMFGPYDSKPSSGAMVKAMAEGKIFAYVSGGRNYVYVKDVARAIVNALKKGRIGEGYILGNQNLYYKEIFEIIAKTIGVKAPTIGIRGGVALPIGFFSSIFCKLLGMHPIISYDMARISLDTHFYTPAKAIHELDMPQTPIEQGIKECYDWMMENGVIKK